METKQQKEALEYFKKYAEDWKRKTDTKSEDEVNIIKQRNDFVLKVIDERKRTNLVLDVGCGTGDLICKIAKRGINAIGVDFAEEMINIAEDNARKSKDAKAKFECCSIFDFHFEPDKYDVISANGFIEYISYEELDKLLDCSYKALKKDGSLVLGSRNRLFNIFSLNKYTQEEIKGNNTTALLLEAVQIVNSDNISNLIGFKTAPLQKANKEHVKTGIEVSTRYQFTPIQLVNMLKDRGFEPIEIYPIHIHGVVPKFKDRYPAIHVNISNLLQNYGNGDMCLIPNSSSFNIHVKKR